MKKSSESGMATIFFVAGVLPILLILATVSLDIAVYYKERSYLQEIADDTALLARKFLPYREAAIAAANAEIGRYKGVKDAFDVEITDEAVKVTVRDSGVPIFGSLYSKLTGSEGPAITQAVTSTAVSNPTDTFIVLNLESVTPPSGTTWGSERDWPAASFMDSAVIQTFFPSHSHLTQRDFTQACFNPVLSRLKEATISLYGFMASLSSNSVGLGVFPGVTSEIDLLSQVGPQAVAGGGSNTTLIRYRGKSRAVELCGAIAERELIHDPYLEPKSSTAISGLWSPERGAPQNLIDTETLTFIRDAERFLTPSKVVWMQPGREGGSSDFSGLLRSGWKHFGVPPFLWTAYLKQHPSRIQPVWRSSEMNAT